MEIIESQHGDEQISCNTDMTTNSPFSASRGNLNGRQLVLHRSVERAISCLSDGEYRRSFAHFIVTFTMEPSILEKLLKQFTLALEKYFMELKSEGKHQETLKCCEQVLEMFPNHPDLLHELGSLFYRMDFAEAAIVHYQKAFLANPFYSHSLYCLENLKNAVIERWHFSMLNDRNRNMAFNKAIKRAVISGNTTVLDIGAGTGILSMMAADFGAEKVFACEKNQYMCEILRNVIKDNGKCESVQVLEKLSTDLTIPADIPERVNLVVTEIFDACLFGEHILEALDHAWEVLLCNEPNIVENVVTSQCNSGRDYAKCPQVKAKVIPYSAALWAVPVECERIRKYTRLNSDPAILVTASVSEPYTSERLNSLPGGYRLLSSPKSLLHVNFNKPEEIKKLLKGETVSLQYECSNGTLDAFVMWFDLKLDDTFTITNAPDQDGCWEQAVFYVLPKHLHGTSKHLQNGDSVHTRFYCEGHVSLLDVRTPHVENPSSLNVTCKPDVIYQLNSLAQCSQPWDAASERPGPIIDLSPFPVLGLRALDNRATELIAFDLEMQNEVRTILKAKGVLEEKVLFMALEDYENCQPKASLLIHYPVDMCGLLKKEMFETVNYLKTSCLKDSAIVIPGKLEVLCTLIDSPILQKQTKLVSDENTLGYKISSSINIYQGLLHFDIDLSTLPHEQLCCDVKLCDIDLNCATGSKLTDLNDMQGHMEIEVTRSGKITAIPFWFVLTYSKDSVVNTSSSSSLYRVAASIPLEDIEVTKGDCVSLYWTCKSSCFYVMTEKMK